jgi:hypothetical protein
LGHFGTAWHSFPWAALGRGTKWDNLTLKSVPKNCRANRLFFNLETNFATHLTSMIYNSLKIFLSKLDFGTLTANRYVYCAKPAFGQNLEG